MKKQKINYREYSIFRRFCIWNTEHVSVIPAVCMLVFLFVYFGDGLEPYYVKGEISQLYIALAVFASFLFGSVIGMIIVAVLYCIEGRFSKRKTVYSDYNRLHGFEKLSYWVNEHKSFIYSAAVITGIAAELVKTVIFDETPDMAGWTAGHYAIWLGRPVVIGAILGIACAAVLLFIKELIRKEMEE